MTNMADCIARGMDFGEIDKARGIAAQAAYQQLFDRYATTMDPARAAIFAAKDIKEATAKAKTARFHKTVNQLQAMRRLHDQILTAPDPAAALRNLLEWSEGSGFTGESVRSLTEAYEASINAEIHEVLQTVGLDVLSRSRDGAMLTKLIRELHGEDAGNPLAKKLAEAVRGAQQRMRRLFNAHGGDIGELADYGVPHAHDAEQLRKAGYGKWAETVMPRLAWDRIIDLTTGKTFAATKGAAPDPVAADRFLRSVYDGIVTGGWNTRTPGMTTAGKALYNQRADHRVLHFASADAWMEYNQAFGTSDPFSAMVNGLHGLARDVAQMRVLGPNPRAGLEFASQVATKKAMTSRNVALQESVSRATSSAKAMLGELDGTANRAEHVAVAQFFGATRSLLTAIHLGSAAISSVTDAATIDAAARHMGMRPGNILARSVAMMTNGATRETAARMGHVAETLAETGRSMSRYTGQMFSSGLPEKLSSFTMRATGLSLLTDMRKAAFKMELSGLMAENAGRSLAEVDAPLRRALEARGITAADWDLLRDPSTHFVAPNGGTFISPHYWLQTQKTLPQVEAEGLAMRLSAMMHEQLEFAIPTVSVRVKAATKLNTAAGTIGGELLRSAAMYKNFSFSLMLNQYHRFLSIQGNWNRALYAARLSTMLVLTGALAVQLKELVKGNDPRPMTEGKFWMAALFQGGGLGIFGDFFAAEQSRVGGGLGETVAGPVVGAVGDAIKPFAANLTAAVKGEKTNFGRDLAGYARRNTPFLSSAWYARLAYDRIVMDQLLTFIDPQADIAFRRRLKQQAQDYGTRPWWLPGDLAPARAPDLSNALGAQQ